ARPYRGRLGGLAGLLTLSALLEALVPWPAKLAIDNVLTHEPSSLTDWLAHVPGLSSVTGRLVVLGLVSVVILVASAVVTSLTLVERQTTGQRMSFDLAAALLAAMQRRSLASAASRQTGDIVQRVTFDSSCVTILVLVVGLGVFGAVSTLVVML